MDITVGTFNLNNLFSRFNFKGVIQTLGQTAGAVGGMTVRYEFTDPDTYRLRTFRGKLVKAKEPEKTGEIAQRILAWDVTVLAVQEVENIDILRQFNRSQLSDSYRYQVLIEGNDPRFIDVGILSKLPIGAITSFQTEVHDSDPSRPVFSRDLLEAEIWNESRTRKLFTVYNNHLKSHFVPWGEDPVQGQANANARRKRQAETIAEIVERRMRPDSRFIVLGDMNDRSDSQSLVPMVTAPALSLVNALTTPQETRPPKAEELGPGPQTSAWTYRHKESGQPPEHLLYDQIWLSPALAGKQTAAWIDRRKKHRGDGSDHDLAWIQLSL